MKKFKFFEKPAAAKTVYIMAAVSFCLAAIAIGIVYSQTMHTLEESLTVPQTTKQVHRNQSGESDPRTTTVAAQKTTTASTSAKKEENSTQVATTTDAVTATASQTAGTKTYILPCEGEIIRPYSPEIPIYCETMGDWRTHSGVDFAVKESEEVLSVGDGKVSKVIVDSAYGYTVEVDYGDFTARYCGLKQGECVGINQILNKGDFVGKVADVPVENKQGVHLHFEIVRDGDYADPIKTLQ